MRIAILFVFIVLSPFVRATSEVDRIQSHLRLVEQLLRNQDTQGLTASQLKNRMLGLNNLHAYWEAGEFPKNTNHPDQRRPYFIDHSGIPCAVANLIILSGHSELAQSIAETNRYDYLDQIENKKLSEWIKQSGFSEAELRLIQPSYAPNTPGTFGHCVRNNLYDDCARVLKEQKTRSHKFSPETLKEAKDAKMLEVFLQAGIPTNGITSGSVSRHYAGSPLWYEQHKLWQLRNKKSGVPEADLVDLEKKISLLKNVGAKITIQEEFLDAVKENNEDRMNEMIKKFPEVKKQILKSDGSFDKNGNYANPEYTRALPFATEFASIKTMKYLIKKGADVNEFADYATGAPLHIAALNNNLEAVKFLIANGADVSLKVMNYTTPLMMARSKDVIAEIRKRLCSSGIKAECKPTP